MNEGHSHGHPGLSHSWLRCPSARSPPHTPLHHFTNLVPRCGRNRFSLISHGQHHGWAGDGTDLLNGVDRLARIWGRNSR